MDILECPGCGHEHDMGGYPDHLTDLGPSNHFNFECASCEATFNVHVECDPVFHPLKDTIKSSIRRAG